MIGITIRFEQIEVTHVPMIVCHRFYHGSKFNIIVVFSKIGKDVIIDKINFL